MRTSAVLCSLFVGAALSAPLKRDYVVRDEVVYVTKYVTAQAGASATTHRHRHAQTYTWSYAAPAPETTTKPAPVPETTSKPAPAPVPETTSKPAPAPAPVTTSTPKPVTTPSPTPKTVPKSGSGPTSGGIALIDTINKWRGKYNLNSLTWSEQLEGNAYKTGTVDDNNGRNQNHHLYPGSMAQVITPGMEVAYGDIGGLSPFELSYVAWLCEASSDPQLKSDGKDYCKLVADNLHMSYSSTGHHDILNSPSYKNIGCAFADDPSQGDDTPYQGLWVCDLN